MFVKNDTSADKPQWQNGINKIVSKMKFWSDFLKKKGEDRTFWSEKIRYIPLMKVQKN
jgi:hypothetical protein